MIPNFFEYDRYECCYNCLEFINYEPIRKYIPQLYEAYRNNVCHDWRYIWYCVQQFIDSFSMSEGLSLYVVGIVLHRFQPTPLAYSLDIPEETRDAILATDPFFTGRHTLITSEIHDISLSVLSAEPAIYAEYINNYNAELSRNISKGDYWISRITKLLKSPIYITNRYDENRARMNLRSSLAYYITGVA